MDAFSKQCARVDGWPINIADMDQAVSEICAAAKKRECFSAFTLNMEHLVKLRADEPFRQAYKSARFVTADGAPVAYFASRSGRSIKRTTGADLLEPLAKAAAENDLGLYLFGTTDETLAAAGDYLRSRAQKPLRIVGAVSPPMGFDPTGPAADAELDKIAQSGAELCFVALSNPKGELLAARAVERGIRCGFLSIGAGLDFLSGRQRRAPKVMQMAGAEWAWRLASDPKKFAGRYAKCAMLLADIALKANQESSADRPSA